MSDHIGEIIKNVQRITSHLRPQIIDDLGLEAAIEWYTKEFSQRNKINVFLNLDSSIGFSHYASLIIFRIMQESLTNIARHSKASRVDVILHKNTGSVHFMIFDNGIGITEYEKNSRKSFGIIIMRERAAMLGGSFEITSENGGGTVIKLIIPLLNTGTNENIDL